MASRLRGGGERLHTIRRVVEEIACENRVVGAGDLERAVEFLAVLCASLFAGAALYINVAEHPARMLLETSAAARQWAPSYRRATWMQAPLALVSCVAGIGAWLLGAGGGWLVAALLIGAVVPFTILAILPTNNRLLASDRHLDSPETRALLERWARLHAVRTALSLAAAGLYVWLLLQA